VDLSIGDEYKKCSKTGTFKLWASFIMGMAVMIIAAAMFDYASLKNQFGAGGATVDSAEAGEISGLGGVAAEVDSSDEVAQKHESKKVSYETETQPFLGIEVMEIKDSDGSKRVLISRVIENSPAEDAGFKMGDEITRFDRRNVEDIEKLQQLISRKSPDERVKVDILRDGWGISIYVVLGSFVPADYAPADGNIVRIAAEQESEDSPACKGLLELVSSLGVSLSPLTEELARVYGLKQGEEGVVVEEVLPGSPASEAGLKQGDLIMEVNQEPTPDLQAFFEAFKTGGEILLIVLRGEETLFMVISDVEEKPVCKRLKEDE